MLKAALRYAELGYAVFPCQPGGKIPATNHGVLDATADAEQIRKWWAGRPDANIGLSSKWLLVIDIDGADNPWPGNDDYAFDLLKSPTAYTPRGGKHHIFRQPPKGRFRNTTGKLAPGVDTRANGGYVVVSPSKREDGKAYIWAEGLELDMPPGELPLPQDWLIEWLQKPKGERQDQDDDLNIIPTGKRNNTLTRFAGGMRRIGMSAPEIASGLMGINKTRCKPLLPKSEVHKIAANVARYEPDAVSVALVADDFFEVVHSEAETKTQVEDPGVIPDELLHVPGFISDVMNLTLKTAPYPNRVMAFCGALALQSFFAGRKVRDPDDVRANIYLLGLGHSGVGKDHPRKINVKIADAVGLVGRIGSQFASGEGVQDAMAVTPCMLFQTDEIDGMLQSISKSKDARFENIMATLLMLYSSSGSSFAMRRKAGQTDPGAIDQPCLTIFGTAIPNHYYEALSDRMLSNGLFARMMILESGPRGKGIEPGILSLPGQIIETARWWADYSPTSGNLSGEHPSPKIVGRSKEAVTALADTRDEAENEYAKAECNGHIAGTTVWARASEHARKLALLYAVSENHKAPQIGLDAASWASEFVLHQARRMLYMADTYVADNRHHALCLKAIKRLRDTPSGVSHSILLKWMKIDAKSFGELISTLQQRGDLRVDMSLSGDKGGRPNRKYFGANTGA